MNRKEGIIVGTLLITTFLGSAFAAPAIQSIIILNDPLNVVKSSSATDFFSRPVTFAVTERTGQFPTPVWTLWNFTVDLTGRDPGSTWITFKVVTGGLGVWLVTSDVDLSQENPLTHSAQLTAALMIMMVGTWSWRVPESGSYTLYMPQALLSNPELADLPHPTAVETWTVTSITFGR